jgi:DNA invertase Pin-like site-specific DNA recombinase
MLKGKKRAAIYCRVASASGNDQFAIEMQKDKVLRYAKSFGYSDAVCYLDNGCSGLTLDRPEFSRLCGDIRVGKISVVITSDLARVGRGYISVIKWIDWLDEQGVKFLTADGWHRNDMDFLADVQKAFQDYASREQSVNGKRCAFPSGPVAPVSL